MRKRLSFRWATALMLGVCLLLLPQLASADKTTKRMNAKIGEAMENYDLMEFESAKSLLMEAILIGEKNDAKEPLAHAYLNLGIVYYSGFGDEDSAKESFESAVKVMPSIEIDVAYRTKEIETLLATAREALAGGSECPAEGLEHGLLDEIGKGQSAEIRAKLAAGDADKMVVFYRSEGELEFKKLPMSKDGNCEYVAKIPSSAAQGEFLHYYVAGLDDAGKEVVRKGSSGSPNIIEVAASGGSLSAGMDENPFANDKGSVLDGEKKGGLFVSIAVGSGSGYVNGPTEKEGAQVECCFAPALLHFMPEIGYYFDEQFAISAAFRGGIPLTANVEGHATFAPAGLLRARYLLSPGGEGLEFNGAIGGGIIRNTVAIRQATVPGMDTDTTAMGPLLLGGGMGYNKSLGGPMRLVAEFNALAAFTAGITELGACGAGEDGCVKPKNGLQFDANLGLLFAF